MFLFGFSFVSFADLLAILVLGSRLIFFFLLYAVPVMSEKSTKVSRHFFGDSDKTRLVLGIRMCYVYLYFFVSLLFTSKGTSLAQIRMDENWVIVTIEDLFGDQKLFMV